MALRTSNLAKLPPELIINIAEFLPPIAAICFSLCCGPIYSLLGIRKLYRDKENFDTIELLEVLERDLPDYIVCYYCKRFHAIKYAKKHIHSYKNLYGLVSPSPCWMANVYDVERIDPYFCFTVFQMAMKRYRQGADFSPILKLMVFEGGVYEAPRWDVIHRVTVLYRIVDGSLLVRKQVVFQVDHASDMPFSSLPCFYTCEHLRGYRYGVAGTVGFTYRTFENWGDLMQCKFCATEFQIDSSEQGDAIVFTRWQNLGEGKPRLNLQWQCRAEGKYCDWERAVFRAGSICSAFEGGEKFDVDVDSLRLKNWKGWMKQWRG